MKTKQTATLFAILAAALYAINVPLSKQLLHTVGSTMMAAFLYLGAGLGMLALAAVEAKTGRQPKAEPLTRAEMPYTIAMVVLDIAAPILLMMGLSMSSSASVSLLYNFEIVATSLIACFVFREVLSKQLWIAIGLVTLASIILGFEGSSSLRFNLGSVFVLGACTCWGLENNCTRMISNKSAQEIVIIKGLCSGLGSLVIALISGEAFPRFFEMMKILLLGFVAYGLSIQFYILAQKELGAAKTSAYYSVAPFLGVLFSLVLLGEKPGWQFYIAFLIMAASTVLMVRDSISLQHTHVHTHTHSHPHRHGDIVHTHEHTHQHSHTHIHGEDEGVHSHPHQDLEDHNHSHS